MLKQIHSDLYKSFHRPYLPVLLSILSALAILFNISFTAHVPMQDSFHFSLLFLGVLPFFPVMIADIVFAEENKFSTLKNTVSFGTGRNRIYFGKLISSIILTLFCTAFTFLVYICSAFVWFGTGNHPTAAFMDDYLLRILFGVLLMIGALFVAMVFAVIVKKNSVFAFSFAGAILIPSLVFEGLSSKADIFALLYKLTVYGQICGVKDLSTSHFYEPLIVTALHIVVFGAIGLFVFRRQEIN